MRHLKNIFQGIIFLSIPTISFASLNVVTTTSDLAAIAKEVGGDQVEVVSIAKGYQDPHFIDAKPSFLLKLKKADLFIQVGLELEIAWAPSLLSNARNPKILPGNRGFMEASEGCDILDKRSGTDRSQGDIHPVGNPHYWLDPKNGRVIAKNITARLAELEPAHAAQFQENFAKFETKLFEKEKEWDKIIATLKGTKVIFYHNAWSNFEKYFGIKAVNFIEPKPGIPPAPAHIQALVNQIKSEEIKLLLVEPYFDSKLPEKIANDTGSKMVVFPTSVGSLKEIETYTDLFDFHLKALSNALTEKK